MDSVKFNMGETGYLRTNGDGMGIITGLLFRPNSVEYYVSWGDCTETKHYDIELSLERTYDV